MSNVIIQKINLYDLDLDCPSSEEEEEENGQKQLKITSIKAKDLAPEEMSSFINLDELIEKSVAEPTKTDDGDKSKDVTIPKIKNTKKSAKKSSPAEPVERRQTRSSGRISSAVKSADSTDTAAKKSDFIETPKTLAEIARSVLALNSASLNCSGTAKKQPNLTSSSVKTDAAVKQGNTAAETVKQGNTAAESVKQGNSAAESVKQGITAAESVKQGNSAAETVKQGNSAAETVKQGITAAESVKQGNSAAESVNLQDEPENEDDSVVTVVKTVDLPISYPVKVMHCSSAGKSQNSPDSTLKQAPTRVSASPTAGSPIKNLHTAAKPVSNLSATEKPVSNLTAALKSANNLSAAVNQARMSSPVTYRAGPSYTIRKFSNEPSSALAQAAKRRYSVFTPSKPAISTLFSSVPTVRKLNPPGLYRKVIKLMPKPLERFPSPTASRPVSPPSKELPIVAAETDSVVIIKDESMDAIIKETWQNIDTDKFVKQEKEMIVLPDNLIDASEKTLISSVQDDPGILDEQYGFFYRGSDRKVTQEDKIQAKGAKEHGENQGDNIQQTKEKCQNDKEQHQDENPDNETQPKKQKIEEPDKISYIPTLPCGITCKKVQVRQVACKSTSSKFEVAKYENVGQNKRFEADEPEDQPKTKEKRFIQRKKRITVKYSDLERKSKKQKVKETYAGNLEMLKQIGDILSRRDGQNEDGQDLSKDKLMDTNGIEDAEEILRKFNRNSSGNEGESTGLSGYGSDSSTLSEFGDEKAENSSNPDKIGSNSSGNTAIPSSPGKIGSNSPTSSGNTANPSSTARVVSNFPTSNRILVNPRRLTGITIKPVKSSPKKPTSTVTSSIPAVPEDFMNVKIKDEKLDEEDIKFLTIDDPFDVSNIKQEQPDDSDPTSNEDGAIVSTKVVSLPPSTVSKPKRIIVIKKPLSRNPVQQDYKRFILSRPPKDIPAKFDKPGLKLIAKTTKPDGSVRYIVKKTPTLKTDSQLRISSVSGAQHPPTTAQASTTTVTFPKTNTKIVVNKQNPLYRCQKCNLLFTKQQEYLDHTKRHKELPGCEKRIIKLEELNKINQFQCSQCSAGFSTLEKLSTHENRHKTEFTCKYCLKKFLLLYRYKEHMRMHEIKREKFLECRICNKKFTKDDSFKEHMETHFPCESYPCTLCGKVFKTQQGLNDHQKQDHTKRLAMKCGLCSYETYVKQNFEKHASMHMRYVEKVTSSTFFKCDECPQSFREKGVLEQHKIGFHGTGN